MNTYEPCLTLPELNFLLDSSGRPSAAERARQVERHVGGAMTSLLLVMACVIALYDVTLLLRG